MASLRSVGVQFIFIQHLSYVVPLSLDDAIGRNLSGAGEFETGGRRHQTVYFFLAETAACIVAGLDELLALEAVKEIVCAERALRAVDIG